MKMAAAFQCFMLVGALYCSATSAATIDHTDRVSWDPTMGARQLETIDGVSAMSSGNNQPLELTGFSLIALDLNQNLSVFDNVDWYAQDNSVHSRPNDRLLMSFTKPANVFGLESKVTSADPAILELRQSSGALISSFTFPGSPPFPSIGFLQEIDEMEFLEITNYFGPNDTWSQDHYLFPRLPEQNSILGAIMGLIAVTSTALRERFLA